MTLYLLFILHHFDVLIHLFERCQYDSLTFFIELGTTRPTENLLHIENANIFVATSWTVVDFSAFN